VQGWTNDLFSLPIIGKSMGPSLAEPWVIGESMETPLGDRWWPNKLWGKDDEAGSTNWYKKPEVVQRALAEAKTGQVYRLGRNYSSAMPGFGERRFVLRIPGSPTGGPFGANGMVYNDEFVAAEIGQAGTQFDGLGHIGVAVNGAHDKSQMRYYNGFTQMDIEGPNGLRKLGVEKLHPINARGILLDIAGAKGVDSLEAGYEIRWLTRTWRSKSKECAVSSSCLVTACSSARAGGSIGSRTTPSTTAASQASAWNSRSRSRT
jgi:hypothetical protein